MDGFIKNVVGNNDKDIFLIVNDIKRVHFNKIKQSYIKSPDQFLVPLYSLFMIFKKVHVLVINRYGARALFEKDKILITKSVFT